VGDFDEEPSYETTSAIKISRYNRRDRQVGVWRSSVARFVRDEEVLGSNPSTPTIFLQPRLQLNVIFSWSFLTADLTATGLAKASYQPLSALPGVISS
jgi:hypothetical protein